MTTSLQTRNSPFIYVLPYGSEGLRRRGLLNGVQPSGHEQNKFTQLKPRLLVITRSFDAPIAGQETIRMDEPTSGFEQWSER